MEEGGGFPGCLRAQSVPCGAPTPGDEQTAHQRRLNFLGSDSPALFAFPGEYVRPVPPTSRTWGLTGRRRSLLL